MAVGAQAASIRLHTNIPPEALGPALRSLAQEFNFQIVYASKDVASLRTRGASGDLRPDEALKSVLAGTGLTFRDLDSHTVTVVPATTDALPGGDDESAPSTQNQKVDVDSEKASRSFSAPFLVAQGDVAAPAGDAAGAADSSIAKAKRSEQGVLLQTITITGTHIRSATGSVLPTQTFTRGDIDQSGLGTVAGFLQTLPANFSGGMSETTDADLAGGGQAGENLTFGTGINLRGLGNDATLVLLDGHRIAPAALFGNFVDVSMIPVDAVGRIDVVTDGASSIYGSDAVGGVVNIVTRRNFNGAETRARFGSDDHNDIHESDIGQTFGRAWGSGSALVAYEFYDKTPLSAADRSFTASVPLPFTLLPEQQRHSAVATLDESVTQDLSLYSDAYFAHRSTNTYDTVVGVAQQHNWSTADSYGAILGARLSITNTTELDVSGDYSVGDADVQQFELPQPVIPYSDQKARSVLSTEEAVLNGTLWSLPGGRLLYALGAQFREESYDIADNVAHTVFAPRRNVSSGFAEVRIPVFGPTGSSGGHSALELSLADREDSYSDVGSTNNETLGLLWRPAGSLKIRGTYGTSFVAPLLNDTNPILSQVAAFNTSELPGSAPPSSGPLNVLLTFGGNAHLKPQTATSWTVGATWNPLMNGGFRADLNYYSIRFDKRINDLEQAGYNPFFALPEAGFLGPQIVQFNPSAALVTQLESSANFVNFGATSLSAIGAIIDSQVLNLSRVKTDGVDLRVINRMERGRTTIEPGLDATIILHLDTQFTSSTPPAEILNTIYNPPRARIRGHLFISRNPFSIAAFVNFVNSYTNNTTTPYTPISSWTTVDLSGTYSCDRCRGFLRGFSATLGILNLFNRAPPYATNGSGFAVNYDGANASPLGRFISLDFGVRW